MKTARRNAQMSEENSIRVHLTMTMFDRLTVVIVESVQARGVLYAAADPHGENTKKKFSKRIEDMVLSMHPGYQISSICRSPK